MDSVRLNCGVVDMWTIQAPAVEVARGVLCAPRQLWAHIDAVVETISSLHLHQPDECRNKKTVNPAPPQSSSKRMRRTVVEQQQSLGCWRALRFRTQLKRTRLHRVAVKDRYVAWASPSVQFRNLEGRKSSGKCCVA